MADHGALAEPAAGGDPSDRRYATVSLLLAVVGGFADAGSYVLSGSFTGHLTGNTVLAMVHLAHSDWPALITCLIAVAAFLIGTAGGASWPDAPGRSACRRLAGPVAVEIMLVGLGLLVAALFGHAGQRAFLASLCLALGLQNGALGKIGSVTLHTTFITGLFTTWVTSIVAGRPGPKRWVLPPIIGCFVVGALCGAAAVAHMGPLGFGLVLLPLIGGLLLAAGAR